MSMSVRRLLLASSLEICGQFSMLNSVRRLRDTLSSVSTPSPSAVKPVRRLRDTSTFCSASKPLRSSVPASFLSFQLMAVMWPFSTVMPSHVAGLFWLLIFRASALVDASAAGWARNAFSCLSSPLSTLCANSETLLIAAASNNAIFFIFERSK